MGVNGAKPSDLIAFGAYSRIRCDEDVGRGAPVSPLP